MVFITRDRADSEPLHNNTPPDNIFEIELNFIVTECDFVRVIRNCGRRLPGKVVTTRILTAQSVYIYGNTQE